MSYTKKKYRNGSARGPVNSQGKPIKNGQPCYTVTNKKRLRFSQTIRKEGHE